ncbi:hypothetical protein Gohar_024584, partial [Gossypium harknessii]|nr:hypothetical protein [Gossypium harknessii]
MEEINWDTLLLEVDLPDFGDILDNEPEPVTEPPPQPFSDDDFLADLLVDSPPSSGGDVAGVDGADLHKQSQTHTDVDKDDPIAKKQRRNRDAAVRSRERKKMYVKDLEMKS